MAIFAQRPKKVKSARSFVNLLGLGPHFFGLSYEPGLLSWLDVPGWRPLSSPGDSHGQRDPRSVWITLLYRRRPAALFRSERRRTGSRHGIHLRSVSAFRGPLGYFKAKQQFFIYEPEALLEDLRHIVERHFPDQDLARVPRPSKPTRLWQPQSILPWMRYRFGDHTARPELERKAQGSARLSARPIFLLREMLQHLSQARIVAPAYKSLQDMVGRVVTGERDRISQMLPDARAGAEARPPRAVGQPARSR